MRMIEEILVDNDEVVCWLLVVPVAVVLSGYFDVDMTGMHQSISMMVVVVIDYSRMSTTPTHVDCIRG